MFFLTTLSQEFMCFMWYPQDYSFCYPQGFPPPSGAAALLCLISPPPACAFSCHDDLTMTGLSTEWLSQSTDKSCCAPWMLTPKLAQRDSPQQRFSRFAILPTLSAFKVFRDTGVLCCCCYSPSSFLPSFLVYYLFSG